MNRRTFLKHTAIAGTTLLSGGPAPTEPHQDGLALATAADEQPNILVIMVDQLRYPRWFPTQAVLDTLLPSLARLRTGAVNFGQHYVAASACTPSRACLLTGLYTHQTGCLLTLHSRSQPALHPGFPTWGTLLRGLGYQTFWYGKWHLSFNGCALEPYGFAGGTCYADASYGPNGKVGEGLARDPEIADQFIGWLESQGHLGPWCTTVSFVNPHDIAWYPRGTDLVPGQSDPPRRFTQLPPNFETPDDRHARTKPRLQHALQEAAAYHLGGLPFAGPDWQAGWLKLLDLYLQVQQTVDTQIGRVLDALAASSAAERTVVIFTSDHGEYAGSHGLRSKGFAIYEEGIRVPLMVHDPTGRFISSPEVERRQLTSSVDILPLMLTLASNGNAWRALPAYAHLANRLDLAAILRDPNAPGRPYILSTSDEDGWSDVPYTPEVVNAPKHVIGYRTPVGKLGVYNHWAAGSLAPAATGQETECYDYATETGLLELDNIAPTRPPLYSQLAVELLQDAGPNELRNPLPAPLLSVQRAAIQAYLASQQKKLFLPLVTR